VKRFIPTALLALAAILALAVLVELYRAARPPTFNGAVIDPPKPMFDFTLQSEGGPVKLSDFRGKFVVVDFGYTSCPDICPTTLAGLSQSLNELGDQDADQFQVIFISVDYPRDSPERVGEYVKNFREDFIGLSGTQEQIDQVTKEWGIYYKINDPDPKTGFSSVDHTAITLVVDRQGKLLLTWPYGLQPDEIASDLQNLLRE
jgi:protein SCO1